MVVAEFMWAEDWLLYHKVVFDGANKLIIVNPGQTTISVQDDIYSGWKEWSQLRDNGKFLPAIRTSGGDPIAGGKVSGDIYFTINGWQVFVSDRCSITGVLYSDDFASPYVTSADAKIVETTVSNLVQSLGFTGTVNVTTSPNVTPEQLWDYLLADANTPGSVGERINKLLTVAKFLGLK